MANAAGQAPVAARRGRGAGMSGSRLRARQLSRGSGLDQARTVPIGRPLVSDINQIYWRGWRASTRTGSHPGRAYFARSEPPPQRPRRRGHPPRSGDCERTDHSLPFRPELVGGPHLTLSPPSTENTAPQTSSGQTGHLIAALEGSTARSARAPPDLTSASVPA